MITTMHSDRNASPPRVEVITSVQRRRRWPTAEKIRLVEETMQAGMSVSYVARRAGVAPSLLFNWRRRCWKAACKLSRLTKMSSERAVSVSWNDGCANWSACSAARQSGHDIVLPIAGLYWQDNSARASIVRASLVLPGLYRSAMHFQNLERTARRFVIEHGDHQPPSIPSEGVKIRSVLF